MRNSKSAKLGLLGRAKKMSFPALAGLAVFTIYPSITSFQDIGSLKADGHNMSLGERWMAFIPQGAGVSSVKPYKAASIGLGLDATKTGSISAEQQPKSLKEDATRIEIGKKKRLPQTVNRAAKGERVVSATIQRPPEHFSAGSVLQRHSFLEDLKVDKKLELAFVKAKPAQEAFEVASTFQLKGKPKPAIQDIPNDLPVMVASLVEQSRGNVLLGYASQEPELKRSPFAAVLKKETGPLNLIPKLAPKDHKWAAQPLPKSSFSKTQQQCLAEGIYFEARGEPVAGQAAVSQVILNRVKNPTYPNTICGVVYQNKHWHNRCQFSFACDNIKDRTSNKKMWSLAQYVARETTAGRIWQKQVGSSTHYHATYVNPKWAKSMKRVGRIGLHIFYRTYGGGWS